MSWFDAKGFCSWLTWRERARGLIGGQDLYRLPTICEWSAAAGIAAF
ncbi:MAG: SUMF1/EgtB/PvdO family nonheme iron enzyme [Verrucomicrobiales bacterium]